MDLNSDLEKKCSDKILKIMQMRWGLLDGEPHSLEETAQAFGTTRERIRQTESMVIHRLSPHATRRKKISEYFK